MIIKFTKKEKTQLLKNRKIRQIREKDGFTYIDTRWGAVRLGEYDWRGHSYVYACYNKEERAYYYPYCIGNQRVTLKKLYRHKLWVPMTILLVELLRLWKTPSLVIPGLPMVRFNLEKAKPIERKPTV